MQKHHQCARRRERRKLREQTNRPIGSIGFVSIKAMLFLTRFVGGWGFTTFYNNISPPKVNIPRFITDRATMCLTTDIDIVLLLVCRCCKDRSFFCWRWQQITDQQRIGMEMVFVRIVWQCTEQSNSVCDVMVFEAISVCSMDCLDGLWPQTIFTEVRRRWPISMLAMQSVSHVRR